MFKELFSLLLLITLTKGFAIKKDEKLVSYTKQWGDNQFNSIRLISGKDTEIVLDMSVDLNYNSVIIFDKDYFTWGIECKGDCEVVSDIIEKETYFSSVSTFKRVETVVRVSDKALDNSQLINKLPVKFMHTSRNWGLVDWGVVGLGPKSDFADYMRVNFDSPFQILLKYEADQLINKQIDFKLTSVLDPTINEKDIINSISFDSNQDRFIKQADLSLNSNVYLENKRTCITNFGNDLFYFNDSEGLCNSIKHLICDNFKDCTKETAVLSSAPRIDIKIDDVEYSFDQEHYLYEGNNNQLTCRFSELNTVKEDLDCDDSELILGKLFFTKFIPVISYNDDYSTTITFLTDYQESGIKNLWAWMIAASVPVIIATFVLIYFCCYKELTPSDLEIYNMVG